MTARLVYFMGPSGVGKDSLLDWLKAHLPAHTAVHWARRTITRLPSPDGELHESVDDDGFAALLANNAFALHWQANGLAYGIRQQELAPLDRGTWVFVNGSRAHWPLAHQRFPTSFGVMITASPDVLRQRLLQRNRETAAEIDARLARLQGHAGDNVHCVVHNDSTLDAAGKQLIHQLQQLEDWPHALHHD
jgi:ribose 1,5-bisphosphokinase